MGWPGIRALASVGSGALQTRLGSSHPVFPKCHRRARALGLSSNGTCVPRDAAFGTPTPRRKPSCSFSIPAAEWRAVSRPGGQIRSVKHVTREMLIFCLQDGGRQGGAGYAGQIVCAPRLPGHRGSLDAAAGLLSEAETHQQSPGPVWTCESADGYRTQAHPPTTYKHHPERITQGCQRRSVGWRDIFKSSLHTHLHVCNSFITL